jgi:poly-gamma-glutamate capsule biosynthesis protein CapA/YwtB (metallophosphatase superfamily)
MRFGGDLILAGHYETAAGSNPDLAFEQFDLFRTDDISLVNLECPITARGIKSEKPYTFRMLPSYTASLARAGIDVVNIANNHIFDYGIEGLFDTISYLDSSGIRHIGAGMTVQEARKPVIFALRGLRIGFLGYYAGGEAQSADDSIPGVNRRSLRNVAAGISDLKARDSADYIIVTFHWGKEKAEQPDPEQIWFAHQAIDAGADAVIGHHTHIFSGIERYRKGVIVYSLGNFVFGGKFQTSYDAGIFEIRLGKSSVQYSVIPVRVKKWKARLLEGKSRDEFISQIKERSSAFPATIFTK